MAEDQVSFDDLPDAKVTPAPSSLFDDIPAAKASPTVAPTIKQPTGNVSFDDIPDKTEIPGYLQSFFHGLMDTAGDTAQSAKVLSGNKTVEAPKEERPEAAGLGWDDAFSPYSRLGPKVAYRLAKGAPQLAAGVLGGMAGTAAIGPGVGTFVGGTAGFAAMSAYQTIGPAFQEALKKNPNDPDAAWNKAVEDASLSGMFSGAGWAAFPIRFFQGPVKQLAFQALGIQPGVAVAHQATKNVMGGEDVTEGLGQAYAEGAVGTAVPLVGHRILKGVAGLKKSVESSAMEKTNDLLDQASHIEKSSLDPNMPPELKKQFQQKADALRTQATKVARMMSPDEPSGPFNIERLKVRAEQFMDSAVGDILNDAQMKLTPMAARSASNEARAIAKDFANQKRSSQWQWNHVDSFIEKNFTPEQRERMWSASDAESVALTMGKPTKGIGLDTLAPVERQAVELLQKHSKEVWQRAVDLGMVKGEGYQSWTPRMFVNASDTLGGPRSLNALGMNLRTTTPQMRRRKHLTSEQTEEAGRRILGEEAELARDIRTLPLATARMQDAVAGRTLIEKIKQIGKDTGQQTVSEGFQPNKSNQGHTWFTIDHPSFKTFENGKSVPLYVRSDFEGPLRSVLTTEQGKIYRGMMDLKGKTMSVIMYSPLIHNAVEWGRALPVMPGKVFTGMVYFEGNAARKSYNYGGPLKYIKDSVTGKRTLKEGPSVMERAIEDGLVPIGGRGFMQDITSMMEQPNMAPGRSLTSKILAVGPGMISGEAGLKVKRAVDKAGDFWHNTLLWDRVADLQMGLYINFEKSMIKKGIDPQSASRVAAHLANRYAGALPAESMSQGAQAFANLALFSRTFTLGNVGAMKDMFVGLPKDVKAQLFRDVGPEGLGKATSFAQRKAIAGVIRDVGLMYFANSILQDTFDYLRKQKDMPQIMKDYVDRAYELLKKTKEHPFDVLASPLDSIQSLFSTSENEPDKENRILTGYQQDGTAVYARNPTGKIGEEMIGWSSGPFDMIKRKLSTVARPIWQIMSNDEGFGHKVYNPNPKTFEDKRDNIANIVTTIMSAQVPVDQLKAIRDLYQGAGDKTTNQLKLFGPLVGLTFSKGAPGGPAIGELYRANERHRYEVNKALPEIRRMIQSGNEDKARDKMTELNIPHKLQQYYIKTTIDPIKRLSQRKLKDFYKYSTEEEKDRLERQRSRR